MARGQAKPKVAGGLTAWQLDLALRLLLQDLGAQVPAVKLAGLCGLSRSYFTRLQREHGRPASSLARS